MSPYRRRAKGWARSGELETVVFDAAQVAQDLASDLAAVASAEEGVETAVGFGLHDAADGRYGVAKHLYDVRPHLAVDEDLHPQVFLGHTCE